MGHRRKSRSPLVFLPILVLLSSGTVLFSAGDGVRISLPAHRAEVSGIIEVKAEVDPSLPVTFVLLVVDGTRPASTNSLPTTFQLDTRELADGPHVVSAEAYADFNMIAASKAITIRVNNQTAQPAVTKQQSTPKTAIAASALHASRTVDSAPLVSTDRITELMGAKRGPAREPSPTGSFVPETSQDRDMAEAADAAPSHAMPMVMLNGSPLAADVAPTLVRGRMHTGFRALFTAAGARIEWLPEQRIARCVTDSLVVEVPIGSRIATVNGRHVDMGAVATIENGRTVVPVRFFAQATGSRVSWDARTRVASVQTPSRAVASAQASLTSAASMQTPVSDQVSTRTPIYEVADLGP
ncbi:MAG: copper amine oxidase N-terminal domain-containing protein [Armatimonadetes bacterium]|nr:copper amine oxidase N-terminal domain-containing protein [Armatimonadota bacterium]